MKKILITIIVLIVFLSGCIFNDNDRDNDDKNKIEDKYQGWQVCLRIDEIENLNNPITNIDLKLNSEQSTIDVSLPKYRNQVCNDFKINNVYNFTIKATSSSNNNSFYLYGSENIIEGKIETIGENLSITLNPKMPENYSLEKKDNTYKDHYNLIINGPDGRLQVLIAIYLPPP